MKINTYNLNLLGLKCPIPLLKISKKFKEIKKGDILIVKTDDPKAEADIEELTKNIRIKVLKKSVSSQNSILVELKKY